MQKDRFHSLRGANSEGRATQPLPYKLVHMSFQDQGHQALTQPRELTLPEQELSHGRDCHKVLEIKSSTKTSLKDPL